MLMNSSLASFINAKTISDWFERIVSQMCPERVIRTPIMNRQNETGQEIASWPVDFYGSPGRTRTYNPSVNRPRKQQYVTVFKLICAGQSLSKFNVVFTGYVRIVS